MEYQPDRSFIKELKRTDNRLDCKFNGSFFVITYDRPYKGPVPIMSVKGENGDFRHPDKRDIDKLKESDLSREDYREKFLRLGKISEEIKDREIKARKRKELFRDITKDNKIQLRQAFAKAENSSKSNAAFR